MNESGICKRVIGIFWDEVLMVTIARKKDLISMQRFSMVRALKPILYHIGLLK